MGIMKQMKAQLFIFMAIALLTSCSSTKKVAYLESVAAAGFPGRSPGNDSGPRIRLFGQFMRLRSRNGGSGAARNGNGSGRRNQVCRP